MDEPVVFCVTRSGSVPEYRSGGAAGADLRAMLEKDIVLSPGERRLVPTGLSVAIPGGWEGQVRPRSGIAVRYGVTVLNAPGTIDSDYRGEIKVLLVNLGQEDFVVRSGDRIAQLVIAPAARAVFRARESIDDTERGSGGFGSTGT